MKQNSKDQTGRLSQTMRIDITPDALTAQSGRRKARIVTKKKDSRQIRLTSSLTSADSDFQQLLQGLYDAAVLTDTTGKILDANLRAVEFFRYGREDLQRLTIMDLVTGSDESLIGQILENLAERFVVLEAYCMRQDSSYFYAEIAVNQLRLSQTECLCFFVRDVTVRRENEEQLRIEDTAIQNAHSGIAITDIDGSIKYANPAVAKMWGFASSEELQGRDIETLFEQSETQGPVVPSVLGEKGTVFEEMVAARADASTFHLQITATSLHSSDDELIGVVFSLVDISDRRRAEDAMRETDRHRVMLESLGAACHHLAQPATILVANLGIMQKKITDPQGDLRRQVDACATAAETLSNVLHRLNAVNEYKTTAYLDDTADSAENRILEI